MTHEDVLELIKMLKGIESMLSWTSMWMFFIMCAVCFGDWSSK
jgi:hypothetical protein